MRRINILLLLLYSSLVMAYDIDSVDVSLVTCEPHDEVYSLYGHTAIHVKDANRRDKTVGDYVVNFGVFDPNVDNFVLRFIFGQTDYMMGCIPYSVFLEEYKYYGSAVYEQHLNLTRQEKERFMSALIECARPENVVYRYNFFYNNCTTRARDIILEALDAEPSRDGVGKMQRGKRTFRDLVHWKTDGHSWAKAGNDLLLGVMADVNTSYDEREFLPEILMDDFSHLVIERTADAAEDSCVGAKRMLVDSTVVVLQSRPSSVHMADFPLSPIQCAVIFLCLVLLLTLIEYFVLHRWLVWVNYSIVCLYGLVGLLLAAMIFSEHPTVRVNLQILVFNPLMPFLLYPRRNSLWGVIIASCCIVLFCVGGFVQVYAEGMMIMALPLLIVIQKMIKRKRK